MFEHFYQQKNLYHEKKSFEGNNGNNPGNFKGNFICFLKRIDLTYMEDNNKINQMQKPHTKHLYFYLLHIYMEHEEKVVKVCFRVTEPTYLPINYNTFCIIYHCG